MKKQLLFFVCAFSAYVATAQAVFPDTWEFRGIHQSFTGGSTPVAPPGPSPAGLDTAVLPTPTGRFRWRWRLRHGFWISSSKRKIVLL
jgi:hypothetical protein